MRERACNNCGGKNYEVVGQNMVKCLFCGTLYVDEQASKDEEFLIARANDFLRELKFDLALDEFNKIISLFPLSFEAFFGRALTKNQIVLFPDKRGTLSRPVFFGDQILLLDGEDFSKAISLAPPERAKTFTEIAKRVEKIKKNYDLTISKNVYDCILCICGKNDEKKQAFRTKILEILNKNELSVFDFEEFLSKEREECSFRAIETARVFVFVAQNESAVLQARNLFERYFSKMSLRKKTKTSFVLCLDAQNVKISNLPKDFQDAKNILDTNSISFWEDLETRIVNEYKNSRKELARIDTVKIGVEKPKKKEYVDVESVTPVELGHFDVENVSGSTETKKKWIFLSLKNGDFETAKALAQQELENDPYSSELLLADFFAEKKIRTQDEFFSKISNFADKERIENILRYASKDFAENFVDRWEMLLQELDDVEYYNQYLTTLAAFKTPNRENFVRSAENKAVATLDDELISNVEKCLDAKEVDRFVEFYFLLAQKSDDKKYFDKILQLDAGHEESNLALMLQKFKTPHDILSYRDRNEVENMLKFLSDPSRVAFVSAVVEMILPVAFLDLEEAQKQLEFYLSYIQDAATLSSLLKKIAFTFQEMKFFTVAEKYVSIAISKEVDDKQKAELYWRLIQIKCHCRSDEELVTSALKPTDLPEWETLLQLGDDLQNEQYGAVVSKNNLYAGEKTDFAPELLDRVQLQEKLQKFLSRNNQILLEIQKQEGLSVKKGVDYFQLQLRPFEKYIEKIGQIEDFEAYQDLVGRIDDRLFALGLSLDMSISVLEVQERSGGLSTVNFDTDKPSTQFEKVQKSLKKSRFLRNVLIIFLEFVPLAFATLLFVLSIFVPKEVFSYFSQGTLIVLAVLSGCVAGGNLTWFVVKKRTFSKQRGLVFLSLVGLGVLNLFVFLLSFYAFPAKISVASESELQTFLANAPHCNFTLEKDLNFDGKNWKPHGFYGNFDGKNHTISNLNSAFLKSNHGDVKNLTVEIFVEDGSKIFGGFACENYGKIENCTVLGEIRTQKSATVGGFVGKNCGDLLLCESRVQIFVEAQKDFVIGGFVGENAGKKENTISKCMFSGEIEANGSKNATVGGFLGKESAQAEIFECFSNAQIVVNGAQQAFVGGLVGSGTNAGHDNYAVGTISTSGVTSGFAGGLYGKFTNLHIEQEHVLHCYSLVQIDTNLPQGLLVGDLNGVFEWCFANGEGNLFGKDHAPAARLLHCEKVEAYDETFGFDEQIWDLSATWPKFLWESV